MTHTFIITHFGAGSTVMSRILDQNSKVMALGSSGLIYDHPSKLSDLRAGWNKQSSRYIESTHYIDALFHNHQLPSKSFYDICNFIYMVREPSRALPTIMLNGRGYEAAANYYAFRLRRLCEMSVKTPRAVLLTYDQLIDDEQRDRKFKQIEEMLGLKQPLTSRFSPRKSDERSLQAGKIIKYAEEPDEQAPQRMIDHCKLVYDKYLTFLADQHNLQY